MAIAGVEAKIEVAGAVAEAEAGTEEQQQQGIGQHISTKRAIAKALETRHGRGEHRWQ